MEAVKEGAKSTKAEPSLAPFLPSLVPFPSVSASFCDSGRVVSGLVVSSCLASSSCLVTYLILWEILNVILPMELRIHLKPISLGSVTTLLVLVFSSRKVR